MPYQEIEFPSTGTFASLTSWRVEARFIYQKGTNAFDDYISLFLATTANSSQ